MNLSNQIMDGVRCLDILNARENKNRVLISLVLKTIAAQYTR